MKAELTSLATAGSSGTGSMVVPARRSSWRPVGFDSLGRVSASMTITPSATGVASANATTGVSEPGATIATSDNILQNERRFIAALVFMSAMIVPALWRAQTHRVSALQSVAG